MINKVYNKNLTKKDIEGYIKSLQLSSIVWNKLNNPIFFENEESEFKNLITRLHRVGFKSSFKPLVMAILIKIEIEREKYKKVISLLEDYSFKLFDIADRQSNTGNSTLYRLAYKVYKNNLSSDDTYNEIEQHLKRYYNFDLFKNQIDELFKTGDRKGYYDWSGLMYFLFEYDQYLRRKNSITDQSSEISWDKDSIEHIYPQSAALDFEEYCKKYEKNDTQKAKIEYDKIQTDWVHFSPFPKEKRWAICNSLGNLLALTSPLNASLTNDAFKFKVNQSLKSPEHQNKGFKYDSISARLVADNTDWTLETIKNRGIQMLDFLWEKLHPNQPNTLTNEDKLERVHIFPGKNRS